MTIQHEVIRRGIDQLDDKFIALRMQLKEANKDWRQNISHPFFIWDVRPTEAATKKQFQIINGVLHHLYTVVFHQLNVETGSGIATDEYSDPEVAKQRIKDLAVQYNIPLAKIKSKIIAYLESQLSRTIDLGD